MNITKTSPAPPSVVDDAQLARILRAVRRKSFAVLSTVSSTGFAHAAGVVYDTVESTLVVHTMRNSRKARNIAYNERVGIVIPVRRLPIGPPFTVQFQARAEIVAMCNPTIVSLIERGQLKKVIGHGALDEPDGCFLRISPLGPVHSYGIGVSMLEVARDPLHAGAREVDLRASAVRRLHHAAGDLADAE